MRATTMDGTTKRQGGRGVRPNLRRGAAAYVTLLLALPAALVSAHLAAQSTVTVHTGTVLAPVGPEASGLSYETSLLLPREDGLRYFRPGNRPLVNVFRTLGLQSLRIGGSSVDTASFALPSLADVDSLFDFAETAGVRVIYSVRLKDGDPADAAAVAGEIHAKYAKSLSCFSIGNEPDYYKQYPVYKEKWLAIRNAIAAAYPGATFCGPDQNPSPELDRSMVRDFGNPDVGLTEIVQHSYPFGCSYSNPKVKDPAELEPVDAADARDRMLAPTAYKTYSGILKGMQSAVAGSSVRLRLSETNSLWYSGLAGTSDRYAAALWATDYLHWWIAHGAAGLNFHTGDRTGGSIALPSRYAAFVTTPAGYEVRPLSYGMLLFHLGAQGSEVATETVAGDGSNVAAYATAARGGGLLVTVINKAHGAAAAGAERVTIHLDTPLASSRAETIALRAAGDDIAGSSDAVTLGGTPIHSDGTWAGKWSKLRVRKGSSDVSLELPLASAVVVRLQTTAMSRP